MSANLLKGLYSVIGHRGFYFKNPNGFDGLSGATVQITKNYKTLGEMLGDEGTVSQTAECLPYSRLYIRLYSRLYNLNGLFGKPSKDRFEINQNLNGKEKIAPLRDTFYIKLTGESIR